MASGVILAMTTAAGANAAENIVAVPEPMEYVKVCDTYGKGFFYIPGTETCLNFNGYIRVEFMYTDTATSETTNWQLRGRLNIDARNDTEWGVLRTQLRLQGNGRGGADANLTVDRGLIQLGGLRLGYSDTFFNNTGWQYARNDGYYDSDQAVFLDYTFKANGFAAIIGVQDSISAAAAPTGSDPYDPYGGASYSDSWGKISGAVIYDSTADELAWSATASIKAINNLGIYAWYMADSGGTRYVTGGLGAGAGVEWQWGVDVGYNVSSQFKVWAGYTDADFVDAGRFGLGVHWNPVSGLSVRPEAVFGPDYTQVRLTVYRFF